MSTRAGSCVCHTLTLSEMVQGKTKVAGQASVTGKSRPKGRAMTRRKAAPALIRHRRDRTAAAINRRNEQLMAGRLAHEGGTLAIVPKPAAVNHYDSSRAATSVKQHKQLQQSNIARHTRMKREGMAVGERGKREKKEAVVGEKRKRGLEGVRLVGDEWFDERDADLEALVYESEHSSDEVDGKHNADTQEDDEDETGDDVTQQGADTAKQAETSEARTPVMTAANSSNTLQSAAVDDRQAHRKKQRAAAERSSSAVVDVDASEDDSVRATKRAKALLGGWFAQRDSKR